MLRLLLSLSLFLIAFSSAGMTTPGGVDVVSGHGTSQILVSDDDVTSLEPDNYTAETVFSFCSDDTDDKALKEDATSSGVFKASVEHSVFSTSSPLQFSAFFLIRAPPLSLPF